METVFQPERSTRETLAQMKKVPHSRERVVKEECDDHTMTRITAITQNTGCTRRRRRLSVLRSRQHGLRRAPRFTQSECNMNVERVRQSRQQQRKLQERQASSRPLTMVHRTSRLRRVCWSLIIFQGVHWCPRTCNRHSHRTAHSNTAARTSWRSAITSSWI